MLNSKILFIADDDMDDLEIFLEAVNEVDSTIQCMSASNGEEALKLLRNKATAKPDLIFLDLNMPRINGKQCLAEIKKSDDLKDIPVIIYTTSSRKADIDATRELGAACFITKPADFKELCSTLREMLEIDWRKTLYKQKGISR